MKIRYKIVLVVLPLVLTPLVLSGLIASLSARNGITGVATRFLRFKADQILTYAEGQWALIVEDGRQDQPLFRDAVTNAIASFALSVIRSDTERILLIGRDGTPAAPVGNYEPGPDDVAAVRTFHESGNNGWVELTLQERPYVAHVAPFEPLGWTVIVAELEEAFYAASNQIVQQMAVILAASVGLALLLLLVFSGYLTRPLRSLLNAMTSIISSSDLSQRVEVLYNDETGRLSHTFNLMISELEKAYESVKSYALKAAVAQTKEHKIRTIFQKYVPNNVIDQFFSNPESMLIGDNRELAVLFSDIRSFTTISESLAPDALVESLNYYFKLMVDSIMSRGGVVDKYIGDAIMAFYGAPVRRDDDALQATDAGLDMLERLEDFNVWQAQKERPPFKIGIGINYGIVTVGNIGSEQKMDYTVIGDMVNVASRLEGLTKRYQEGLLVSEEVKNNLRGTFPSRLMDRVTVKGKTKSVGVFAVKRTLTDVETEAWETHNQSMEAFFSRDFFRAVQGFERASELLGGDKAADDKAQYCRALIAEPPDNEWTGETTMQDK